MSIAEQTARNIYETYHFAELPTDVKRHLVFLFSSPHSPESIIEEDVTILPFANDEENLKSRAMQSYKEIKEGKSYAAEEMMGRLEARYPWLCE